MMDRLKEFKTYLFILIGIITCVIGAIGWMDDNYASVTEVKSINEKINEINENVKEIRKDVKELLKNG